MGEGEGNLFFPSPIPHRLTWRSKMADARFKTLTRPNKTPALQARAGGVAECFDCCCCCGKLCGFQSLEQSLKTTPFIGFDVEVCR